MASVIALGKDINLPIMLTVIIQRLTVRMDVEWECIYNKLYVASWPPQRDFITTKLSITFNSSMGK